MNIEIVSGLSESKLNILNKFLEKSALTPDPLIDNTVLVWDNDELIATGSRKDNVLKCIAVDENRQGEGLTATVLTSLRKEAFDSGLRHLFLYTKPENCDIFSSLFFYPIAKTDKVLLMENKKHGITDFVNSLPKANVSGNIGSIVMNCNPFTLGHRYLIETASEMCDHLYIFVVSEDKSTFSFKDRFEMVKLGVSDISNVTVLETGPYMISSATFPTYFLKENDDTGKIQCMLDIEVFKNYFVPTFSINRRFVGTEPDCVTTRSYNSALKENLPCFGVEVTEIPRLKINHYHVSASTVRKLLYSKDKDSIKRLVPATTYNYLKNLGLL